MARKSSSKTASPRARFMFGLQVTFKRSKLVPAKNLGDEPFNFTQEMYDICNFKGIAQPKMCRSFIEKLIKCVTTFVNHCFFVLFFLFFFMGTHA